MENQIDNKELNQISEAQSEREIKQSSMNNRAKKKERRDAKAARKAANKVEEKKTRPNNIILGVMIFGILILMFAAVTGYNYFSKVESIEKYLENNKDQYTEMTFDQYTKASFTAEGNSMKMVLDVEGEDEVIDELKAMYEGENGKKNIQYLEAYFLTLIKPNTRGFSADVTATINVNGEELITESMTLKEAKKFLKDQEKEAEAAREEAASEETSEEE